MIKCFILILLISVTVFGETGYEAWLRYPPVAESQRHKYSDIPEIVVTTDESPVLEAGVSELSRGLKGLLNVNIKHQKSISNESSIILTTIETIKLLIPDEVFASDVLLDGYHIQSLVLNNSNHIVIAGRIDAGVLYGTFALLRKIALYKSIESLNETQNPYSPLRYTNEWDNLDGSIERGWAGKSIFYANNNIVQNLSRAEDYARLLSSVGINGCAVNNVNANTRMITSEFLPQLQRLAKVFSRWAVRIVVSVDFASPQLLGGLNTYDPLDKKVIEFWNNKTNEIYKYVPDLGGYIIKTDAEGRAGPSKYNRTAAEAANVFARALKPHNGVIFYRGFVYHMLDWHDLTVDRAKAAYETFQPLDGQFDDNAIVQIKFGPLDFQVREGISSLFGALRKTNTVLELEVTQEYTGHQRHVVFLPKLWKWVMEFDMKVDNKTSLVKNIVSGKHFGRPTGGMVGVVNVGLDENWMANDLSMSNIYGLGRLGWDGDISVEQISDEWTRLTFGHNETVVEIINQIQLQSHAAFENYSGPLGAGSLTDLVDSKYGPNVMASENNGWGQWHRADEYGIGMERSVAGFKGGYGTGYIGQYNPLVTKMYEDVNDCPDNVLLFMHHVNYTHVLHSGKTVIQHIYDSHYAGAETAQTFYKNFTQLKGLIDDQRYESIKYHLHYQLGHSVVWRDSICQFFHNISKINDIHDRIGHSNGRIEVETMKVTGGYVNITLNPWESASAGLAISCPIGHTCSAATVFNGTTGAYDISVQYYDEDDGISDFKLFVESKLITEWKANETLVTKNGNNTYQSYSRPCGDTSTRITATNVQLRNGDTVRVDGVPNGGENAVLDYIEILQN